MKKRTPVTLFLLLLCSIFAMGCEDSESVIMKAKSEASEVGPAAMTYVKLQEAYFSETEKIGTAEEIGYIAPESKIFQYDVSQKGILTAVLLKDLGFFNKCPKGSVWTIKASPKDGSLQFNVEISSPNPKACEDLTPNFKKLQSL
ncbi:hypothetical protein [uncultured Fibrobacter sp.]|uniref:hypothetical protein n=1 Tax=uncultured Fibrobacter sp. TaxID=261512 RepID=UPI0028039791|nr:hypothetical protein [uncultured Fibrobacter sp.]